VPVIAQLVQADEDTVRDVIHRFNEIGLACLDPNSLLTAGAAGPPAPDCSSAGLRRLSGPRPMRPPLRAVWAPILMVVVAWVPDGRLRRPWPRRLTTERRRCASSRPPLRQHCLLDHSLVLVVRAHCTVTSRYARAAQVPA
jgi:hypothetical protein